jgi:two-component system, chemotaxis family, response regulator Rcp1
MLRPIRVLLVEDNSADADLARETLEASSLQLDLFVVKDGQAALAFLRKQGKYVHESLPDLIVLDLNLPKMDGREVLAEVKTDANLRQIPIVIFTSSQAEKDIATSYGLGANCYLIKPLDFHAFQKIVRAVESFWFTIVKLPTGVEVAAKQAVPECDVPH